MSKMIAVLEVEFDADMMYDEAEAIADYGSYLKAMQWLFSEENMGLFDAEIILVDVKHSAQDQANQSKKGEVDD